MLAKKFYAQRSNNAPSYNTSAVSKSTGFRVNKLKSNIIKSNFKILPENNSNNYIKEKEASILKCNNDVIEKTTCEIKAISQSFDSPPTISNYTGTVYDVNDEATLVTYCSGGGGIINGDIINILSDITITSPISLSVNVEIRGNGNVLQSSLVNILHFNADVLLNDIYFINTSSSSVANCIYTTVGCNNLNIKDCIFETNENGISISVDADTFNIDGCIFQFVGTPDSNRYISIQKCTNPCFITNCIFDGNGAASPSSQCILMNGNTSDYENGSLHVYGCNNVGLKPVQRLMMIEIDLPNTFKMYFKENTFVTSSGYIIHYSATPFNFHSIYLLGNIELSVSANSGKGMLGADNTSNGVLGNACIYAYGNTTSSLRSDYSSYMKDLNMVEKPTTSCKYPIIENPLPYVDLNIVAYKTSLFTPSSLLTLCNYICGTTIEKVLSKGYGCNIFKPVLNTHYTNNYILRKHCVLSKELQKPKLINNSC